MTNPLPKHHQLRLLDDYGLDWKPLLLAGCVGSGKTAGAILLDEQRRRKRPRANPTLVVCPASVKMNWMREIQLWCGKPAIVIDGDKKTREKQIQVIEELCKLNTPDVLTIQYVVTNFDTVRLHWQWFQSHHWYQLIVDEAHNIKNPSTIRTHSVKAINAYGKLALSGTPIANKPNDLWSLLHFLEPGSEYPHKKIEYTDPKKKDHIPPGMRMRNPSPTWGSYLSFVGRYCSKNEWGAVTGGSNLEELNRRLSPIMVRWKREEVLPDLPPLTVEMVPIELTPQQLQVYMDLRAGFFEWLAQKENGDKEYITKEARSILARLTYFRRITSMSPARFAASIARDRPEFAKGVKMSDSRLSAKAAWIEEFIDYKLDEEEKVVILSNWADTIEELAKLLAKHKPSIIMGGVSSAKRQEAVDKFEKVFLGTSAAWEGINLQSANTLIWTDLPWNSTGIIQGNGRIHRLGQDKPCDVFYLLGQETIDENIMRITQNKAKDIAQAIDAGNSVELLQLGLENIV